LAIDESYGEITARYYDAAYAALRDPSGDREFYRKLAQQARGSVLELGCGTGRVLLPIAREGIECTGLDASARMLATIREKSPPRNLKLVCAPMERFDLGGERFALVYSAFRAFQHLETVEQQLACLACVRRHLAPGGAFALDVFAPRLQRVALAEEPEQEDARFGHEGAQIVRKTSVRRDLATQVQRVRMRYERWRGGERLGEDVVEFTMRYFFRYELEHLLARAGFADLTFYGAFDRRPYDYFSGETICVARL
jgi:SAM-dependent methyltransferase